MKRRLLCAVLSLSLLLTGCASLLERDYVSITPHNANLTAEGDPSVLRAESYQELVNALIFFINLGTESGSIRLYLDAEDVEADVEAACLEVIQEDPLGAYAVEHIKYTIDSVVTYYEADIQITYRRTREQVASIVSATGTTAIRSELEHTLERFDPEQVLRISYFDGDETYIRTIFQEAYYATPASALDLPEIDVTLYPETGRQRIVEILLTYHLEPQELERRREQLLLLSEELTAPLLFLNEEQQLLSAAETILSSCVYDPQGGSTAYHALVEGQSDSLGLALAAVLLCGQLDREAKVVSGSLDGHPHFWTVVSTESGWRHLDLSRSGEDGVLLQSDLDLESMGYSWNREAVPACTVPEENVTPE